MRHAPESLAPPSPESLAARVSALVPGCPCFCCGSPLLTSSIDLFFGYSDAPGLICPECDAGVSDEAVVVIPAVFREGKPELVAA